MGTEPAEIREYEVKVELLAITPDNARLVEQAGRLCYDSGDKLGTKPGWLKARIRDGHESIIEHASATFFIEGSRAMTHELVRHRLASYSQRSQRYVRESEPQYITPPELFTAGDAEAGSARDAGAPARIFHDAMEQAWQSYGKLLESGVKPEIARYVLPNACVTRIICTWNFREIRHIIRLRTSKAALPEIRAVAGKLKAIMQSEAPDFFNDL